MPKANWGISSTDVDEFDRDSQYKPYMGPVPPNAVYLWEIKKMVFVAATDEKVPQLRLGLALKPRNKQEKKYDGYYITSFVHISETTRFRYVPLLDALGVSGKDFVNRTITDEQMNVQRIGQWRNTGNFVIAGQLVDNDPEYAAKNPKQMAWMGAPPEELNSDEDDDFDDEDADFDEDDNDDAPWDEEEEDSTPKTSRTESRTNTRRRTTSSNARSGGKRRTSRRNDF